MNLLDLRLVVFVDPYGVVYLQVFNLVVVERLSKRPIVCLYEEVVDSQLEVLRDSEPQLVKLHLFVDFDLCLLAARVHENPYSHVFVRIELTQTLLEDMASIVAFEECSKEPQTV